MKNSKILTGKFTLKYWVLINAIKSRFEQEDYKHYIIFESQLLKRAKDKSYARELETVLNSYSEF